MICVSISADKYNDFIDANRMECAADRLKTMKKLVRVLQNKNFNLYVIEQF